MSTNTTTSSLAFTSLGLKQDLVKNLSSLGYEQMTPIQAKTLPELLNGKDVIGEAKTGSGKTAAFGLALLNKLEVKRFRIQSMVLCPTRELADQVAKELRKLARGIHNIKILTLCGGTPFGPQIGSLEHGAHIIVGTPGRIEEHVIKGTLPLENLNLLVLDEADRMLEMGFQAALDNIVGRTPLDRQTLLFSATFPEQIKAISDSIMTDPVLVKVASNENKSTISQKFFKVNNDEERLDALRLLLLDNPVESTAIFCNTKKETQQVAESLHFDGFSVLALHGDLEQRDRDQTLLRFANKSASILVATDVAARGLDIDSLDLVINYHIARDSEVHVHRIGRTGRAGSTGIAFSLFSDKESYKVGLLEDYLEAVITPESLPSLAVLSNDRHQAKMATIQIDGGKKQKVRPGDILGALTGNNGIQGSQVGKISVLDNKAYVAVTKAALNLALKKLSKGKMKGRTFNARHLTN
ncbi:ATP-dependent RNA helicase DbpA [Colwellia psychrerythraea]|uniref:DEAD/DEAH box helicase domain protein n=1 Tax=Colwellia psychrerythraea TaxID=28229 RepID=A0A099KLK6_COLPS|nr:ATP-dependent RNA helicase DbpA [Colwellia psychrerythraea]KGJ91346.1 DEAD/DEAH box helicase domain protein [Colwellia psychrerythraea]